MGGYSTNAQSGSVIFCQERNASRRHSRSQSGSCFFMEMKRTTSSFSPGGRLSASMSVTQPHS